jgi:hypothetical protein
MLRAHRQPPERQLVQQFADRALVQTDVEGCLDPLLQINAPPAHHPVALGSLLDPIRRLDLCVAPLSTPRPPRR